MPVHAKRAGSGIQAAAFPKGSKAEIEAIAKLRKGFYQEKRKWKLKKLNFAAEVSCR